MPPKKKEVEKVVEDKTFGMKNKNKSSKVQKYIQGLKASASTAPKMTKDKEEAIEKQQKHETEKAKLLAAMFGTVAPAKKKKEKKEEPISDKIDIYSDPRAAQAQDDMADWDQAKLESVINEKHAVSNQNATEIVCKFFLEAVQKQLYGYFWMCPNGETCKYRHALPPGYVLKKLQKSDSTEDEEVPIEEQVEIERSKITNGTPVTEATFKAWLEKHAKEKKEMESKKEEKKKKDRVMMSGKDLFVMDPSLFVDDDGAASEYEIDEDAFAEEDPDLKESEENDNGSEDEEEDVDTEQY
jgi:DRG Family Regulatory Proteins, Tma46